MTLNSTQVTQLLKPIRRERVLKDGKGHSHVSQQDITAHLIRVFGFGNFDTDLVSLECVFERERLSDKGVPANRFDVCYRAVMRLTIRDGAGREVCHYEDGSTATAQNQTLGDAHDLAMKSAISLAKKRAAINLGDQFGLSLYNKGQTSALVLGTIVQPPEGDAETPDVPREDVDVQDGVQQQLSLGNDETDYDTSEPAHAATLAAVNEGLGRLSKTQRDDVWQAWKANRLPNDPADLTKDQAALVLSILEAATEVKASDAA